MYDLVYYIGIYVIEAVIFYMYCYRMFGISEKKIAEAAVTVAVYVAVSPAALLKMAWLNMVCFFIINLLLLHFLRQVPIQVALFHSAVLLALMAVSELIVADFIPAIGIRFYRESDVNESGILYLILNKTLYLILTQMTGCISRDKTAVRYVERSSVLLSIAAVLSAAMIAILLMVCVTVPMPAAVNNLMAFGAFLLLVITVIIFAMQQYYQMKAQEYADLQTQLQREYDMNEYYQSVLNRDEQQHIMIHDIKNHLNTIAMLNESDSREKIAQYINKMMSGAVFKLPKRICNHDIMNIIAVRYMNMCNENRVNFMVDIRSNTLTRFNDTDITTLFCNLLDNAYEAAKTSRTLYDSRVDKEDDPEWDASYAAFISLEIKPFHNDNRKTLIKLVNSCAYNPFSSGGKLYTTKPDKRFHGYGVRSIHRIVDYYHGDMEQYYEETRKEFHTVILV